MRETSLKRAENETREKILDFCEKDKGRVARNLNTRLNSKIKERTTIRSVDFHVASVPHFKSGYEGAYYNLKQQIERMGAVRAVAVRVVKSGDNFAFLEVDVVPVECRRMDKE